jgi:FtsH-binding integral membrane protein
MSVATARFMGRVYAWMTAGLALTAVVAWGIGNNEEMAAALLANRALLYGAMIAQFGLVIALSAMINRISSLTAAGLYFAYAALTGVTLSFIFIVYTQASVAQVFGLTAFSFAGLSAVGLITKKDLGPIGSFCTMGLWGVIGYSLLSMFMPSMMGGVANQVFSAVGVVVFAGLAAYDTQKIKAMSARGYGNEEAARKGAIFGALTLYLDFINLFLFVLRLTGRRNR